MAKKTSQTDVLKFGPAGAALKRKLPRKKWLQFLKETQRRGVTVEGALSGAPSSLQERRPDAIRKEAARLIGQSYKPVEQELDSRQRSAENLAAKRREDEAKYAQWITGEHDKLDAQARAADATLLTTQTDIANDAEAARKAAQADSLQRMAATPGAVSDPTQSTALDQTQADAHSTAREAAARGAAADQTRISEDTRQAARGAMAGFVGASRGQSEAANSELINSVFKDRQRLGSEKAGALAGAISELTARNQANAQRGQEMSLAAQELGIKRLDIAAQIQDADRKYNLESKKFKLSQWVERNKALADRAKLQLGYDKIESTEGQKAADRALREWVEQYKAKQKRLGAKDEKAGVTKDERSVYSDVETARRLVAKMHRDWDAQKPGAIHPDAQRDHLRKNYGISDALIDAASALFRSQGVINSEVRKTLRRLGMKHLGYFYGSTGSNSQGADGSPH